MAKAFAFQVTPLGLVVIVHDRSPTDEEWQAYLDACRARKDEILGYLGGNYGGAPDALQRQKANEEAADFEPRRSAILNVSTEAGGAHVMRATRGREWFNVFALSEVEEALAFLELGPEAELEGLQVLADLTEQVGIELPEAQRRALERRASEARNEHPSGNPPSKRKR